MNIVLLGSGNVATHLGKAFSAAKHTILQVWSRNLQHAQDLSHQVSSKAIDELDQIDPDADLYVVSVVDDAILSVLQGMKVNSASIVHTSGSTEMEVLQPYASEYGVFYPLQTFSKKVSMRLDETPILIEASHVELLGKLEELARSISSQVQFCSSSQRLTLHIAAVFACNFTNHLYAVALKLLQDNELGFNLIRPLIIETAEKVMKELPSETQTGPAVRGDELTMERHRNLLKGQPDLLEIYTLLSRHIEKVK